MPKNRAAWLAAKAAKPLSVDDAPYTSAGPHEIIVRNRAVAINPVDWSKQLLGDMMFSFVKYPFVLGEDLAGEVAEVGSKVTRFRVGDRILAHAIGMDPKVNRSVEGAFQVYTVVRENMASPIPTSLSYVEACVLPLCLSTAACGLFQKDFLALDHPRANAGAEGTKPNGKTVLVWGGSTSVGGNAIQLAVAAGYSVVTTASPKNFDYVKSLGASHMFDYRSRTVVAEIVALLQNKPVAGAIAVGNGSTEACIDVLSKTKSPGMVAQISFPWPDKVPPGGILLFMSMLYLAWWNVTVAFKSKMAGVKANFVFGSSLFENEVSTAIYKDFLPEALKKRKYVAAPPPQVVGDGLENIQKALDLQMEGVSVKKIVVTL